MYLAYSNFYEFLILILILGACSDSASPMEQSSEDRGEVFGLGQADGGGLPGQQSLPHLHQGETGQAESSSNLGGVGGGVQGQRHSVRGVLVGQQFLHNPVHEQEGHVGGGGLVQASVQAGQGGLPGQQLQLSGQDETGQLSETQAG